MIASASLLDILHCLLLRRHRERKGNRINTMRFSKWVMRKKEHFSANILDKRCLVDSYPSTLLLWLEWQPYWVYPFWRIACAPCFCMLPLRPRTLECWVCLDSLRSCCCCYSCLVWKSWNINLSDKLQLFHRTPTDCWPLPSEFYMLQICLAKYNYIPVFPRRVLHGAGHEAGGRFGHLLHCQPRRNFR